MICDWPSWKENTSCLGEAEYSSSDTTRPSVNYAKDGLDQSFPITGLGWSKNRYHLWMWPLLASQQPFSCVLGHFRHGDDNRPNKQPGYPSGQCEGSLLQLGFQTEFMITWLMRVMKHTSKQRWDILTKNHSHRFKPSPFSPRCVYQRNWNLLILKQNIQDLPPGVCTRGPGSQLHNLWWSCWRRC